MADALRAAGDHRDASLRSIWFIARHPRQAGGGIDRALALLAEPGDTEAHLLPGLQVDRIALSHPHPGGVPVEITSPGCRLMNWLM
jgi:hypothetical protein